jgi:hypothetical protein
MRKRLALAGLLLAASFPAPVPPIGAAEITKERLDEIVKELEASAERWLKGEEIDKALEGSLKSVSFDKDSVTHLNGVLRASRRDTAHLYAASRLLGRLTAAKPEVVRRALPNVKSLHNRAKSAYRSIPRLSRAQAEALVLPDSCRGLTTDAIMARMSVLESRRDQKTAREEPIVKHNRIVGDIEKSAYRLLVLADDPKEDAALVKAVFLEEHRGNAIFLTILDELTRNIQKMSPERARKLCPLFRPHLARIAMQNRRPYANRAKVEVSRSGTSSYERKDDYAGIRVLTAYNRIVRAARSKQLKPVKVPTRQEIEEYQKKRKGQPRR